MDFTKTDVLLKCVVCVYTSQFGSDNSGIASGIEYCVLCAVRDCLEFLKKKKETIKLPCEFFHNFYDCCVYDMLACV